jgi:hypothetical protein
LNLRRYTEAPGKPFKKLLDTSSVKDFEGALGLSLASVGQELERQLQALHHTDGHTFPISVKLVADSSGGILAKILSLDDVMGVLTIDEVGAIRNCNEYVAQIFGEARYCVIHPPDVTNITRCGHLRASPICAVSHAVYSCGHFHRILVWSFSPYTRVVIFTEEHLSD